VYVQYQVHGSFQTNMCDNLISHMILISMVNRQELFQLYAVFPVSMIHFELKKKLIEMFCEIYLLTLIKLRSNVCHGVKR